MATAKEIKQRIKSIKNTEKTTKAMELVAAAKMRRAIQSAVNAKPYYESAWGIVERVSASAQSASPKQKEQWKEAMRFFGSELPLDQIPADEHVTVIAFASNRGLCGAYNSHIVKMVAQFAKGRDKGKTRVLMVGNRGAAMLSTFEVAVEQAYEKNDRADDDASIQVIAQQVFDDFAKGETDRVLVAYTDFISPIVNNAVMHQLYPLAKRVEKAVENMDEQLTQRAEELSTQVEQNVAAQVSASYDFLYEPTPARVVEYLIPRIGQVELYQALLQSNASEHSSRMIAMKNATDAAKDMAKQLVLVYNRARQAAITKEIAEIAAGASALE